jgi:putative CocE/NonD family hydrolase
MSSPRTPLASVGDRVFARVLGLPKARCGYSVTRDVRVPMRDGIDLLADHFAPTASTARGTVLIRSPYGRRSVIGLQYGRVYAQHGYHSVVQSCRGTFGSGGHFVPWSGEQADGADTLSWLRQQSWFEGRFATLGLSYLGFTQWCLLADPPPELVTAVIVSGPHDTGRLLTGGGVLTLESALNFSHGVVLQEERGMVSAMVSTLRKLPKQLAAASMALPLSQASYTMLDGRASWFEEWLSHPDPSVPYWHDKQATVALERTSVPVLLYSGWQDMMLDQTLEQYEALHARGVNVALSAGSWTHGDLATRALGQLIRESLDWLAENLAQDGRDGRTSPVKVFVTGAKEWRDLQCWPPESHDQVLYLQPDGVLSGEVPSSDSPPSRFIYDPSSPTPTVGGLTNSLTAGSKDNKVREERPDVLTFTTQVLTDAVDVVGSALVELFHGTDNAFADIFVRLCEVDPKGRSRNLGERNVRLDGAKEGESVRLQLSAIAHRFRPGTRIRLQVSGGSHPQYARNLGTGESQAQGTSMAPSHRTICHGAGGISRVRLPVVFTT